MGLSTFEVRRNFLDYFRRQGHQEVASSPVVPLDDPTLLFTNAGMNQFKDVFLGKAKRDYTRATTSQKCIRAGGKHNDLENVGHTSRHLTFFEMLGNFSFGDYFKKEAIKFAWEVSTQVFQFPEEKIWPTVFRDDDEAFELWRAYVPASRITRFGEKENFWAMGETGPCGPCSELLFDKGTHYGTAKNPLEDTSGERFLEFWNCVFMQFNRSATGAFETLPRPSIDTGAGLERVVSLIQGKESVYETDVFLGLIAGVERLAGKTYDLHSSTAPAFRVIADHLRSLSFAIADGAQPSNTDRGYVLRKILRRAVRYGRQLGFEEPFMGKLLGGLVALMGDPYQELKKAQTRIEEILTREEEAFFKTLRRGGNILSRVIQDSKKATKMISGDDAFLLKDTYGLPFEEIQLIAIDNALSVDQDRFAKLEAEAKERSKAARKTTAQVAERSIFETILQKAGKNTFIRTPLPELAGMVVALIKDGQPVEKLQAEDEGMIILDQTPFYAEMGGQVGDRGSISNPSFSFMVSEAKTPYQGIIAHIGRVEQGSVFVGDSVHSSIDEARRDRIEANHTATHLLHFALHEVLGEHTRQCGSLVSDEYLRFDFAHHKALTQEELDHVERRVNELICENSPVLDYEIPLEEAQKQENIKQFFGEKYGNTVRVLEVGPSKELCGGTHVVQTGKIGYFRILGESSIAAGVRRIEAVTGPHAVVEARSADRQLAELADLFKVPVNKLTERMVRIERDMKNLESELKALKRERMQLMLDSLTVTQLTSEYTVVSGALSVPAEELKMAADEIASRYPHAVIAIGCAAEGRAHLLVKVPQKAIASGLNAGLLLKRALPIVEGNGGGKAEMAQGAGKRGDMLENALQQIVIACE